MRLAVPVPRQRQDNPPHVVAIEVKRAESWDRTWEKSMRSLAGTTGVKVDRMIGVYCGSRTYLFEDLQVLPLAHFVKALYSGEVF